MITLNTQSLNYSEFEVAEYKGDVYLGTQNLATDDVFIKVANPFDLIAEIQSAEYFYRDGGAVFNKRYPTKSITFTVYMQAETPTKLLEKLDEFKLKTSGENIDFGIIYGSEHRIYKSTVQSISVPSFRNYQNYIDGIEVTLFISGQWEGGIYSEERFEVTTNFSMTVNNSGTLPTEPIIYIEGIAIPPIPSNHVEFPLTSLTQVTTNSTTASLSLVSGATFTSDGERNYLNTTANAGSRMTIDYTASGQTFSDTTSFSLVWEGIFTGTLGNSMLIGTGFKFGIMTIAPGFMIPGYILFGFRIGGTTHGTTINYEPYIGTYTRCVWTYNGTTRTLNGYINGENVATTPIPAGIQTDSIFSVGGAVLYGSTSTSGTLHYRSVIVQRELTQSEVLNLEKKSHNSTTTEITIDGGTLGVNEDLNGGDTFILDFQKKKVYKNGEDVTNWTGTMRPLKVGETQIGISHNGEKNYNATAIYTNRYL